MTAQPSLFDAPATRGASRASDPQTELAEMGMVARTGDTRPGSSHRHQMVWRITDKGREAVA